MPAAMRNDADIQKMKDQIAKESDPRKRADLQKRLSEMKGPKEEMPKMTGTCCGSSPGGQKSGKK